VPIRYDIEKDGGLVRVTVEGSTEEKDWADALDAMAGDPDFEPGRMLIDVRKHESVAPSDIMWKIGRMTGSHALNARWALVVSRPVSEGMANMLSTLVDKAGVKVKAYRSLEEAEAWLSERDEA